MKPLNQEERRKAFIQFFLLFVLSVGLVIAAVFFGWQIPTLQNEKLRKELALAEQERNFAAGFAAKMVSLKGLLDSVNRADVRAELLDSDITVQLQQMNANIIGDSAVTVKNLYQNVVQTYSDLQMAKKQLRSYSGKDANIDEYQKTIADYQQKLAMANQTIEIYRSQQR